LFLYSAKPDEANWQAYTHICPDNQPPRISKRKDYKSKIMRERAIPTVITTASREMVITRLLVAHSMSNETLYPNNRRV
jgi:hypothetical protein